MFVPYYPEIPDIFINKVIFATNIARPRSNTKLSSRKDLKICEAQSGLYLYREKKLHWYNSSSYVTGLNTRGFITGYLIRIKNSRKLLQCCYTIQCCYTNTKLSSRKDLKICEAQSGLYLYREKKLHWYNSSSYVTGLNTRGFITGYLIRIKNSRKLLQCCYFLVWLKFISRLNE